MIQNKRTKKKSGYNIGNDENYFRNRLMMISIIGSKPMECTKPFLIKFFLYEILIKFGINWF
ncbi:hypothetical protein C2G38_2074359 [Gigaspora rosea]|uniref:Uncharacterized protein n=1 Tax=Gigaspora rosea TaxID=44941 RepID=A0A397VM08_9GLOM|nr:hypothetical protein C2G38_2074359 [Gigaspora rosea]